MSPVMLSLATLLGLVALLPSSLVGWLLPRLDDPPVASPGWVFVRAVLAGVTVGVGCGLALGKSLSAMVTWTFGGALAASAVVVLAARRQA